MNATQKQFEEWTKKEGFSILKRLTGLYRGTYESEGTQVAWYAWNASRGCWLQL